ncbi:MAG: RPA family protein [Methanothrix sp.]
MAGATGFSREVARRIFAEELKSSNYSFRDGTEQNQYAPSYLLTPTGAKCNRIFLVGTLTEKDDIGSDTEYWRGRVVDPTGSILIYAGQYQPEAAQKLAGIESPSFVAVVGKPNLYQTDDGNIIISVRAESIQKVDEDTRNRWILDTARRTQERLEDLKKAAALQPSGDFATADSISSQAIDSFVVDAERALQHYNTDIEHFRQMVLGALRLLKTDLRKGTETVPQITVANSVQAEEAKRRPSGTDQERGAALGKGRPKKSGSLEGWPETEKEDEIESFNFGKKS